MPVKSLTLITKHYTDKYRNKQWFYLSKNSLQYADYIH